MKWDTANSMNLSETRSSASTDNIVLRTVRDTIARYEMFAPGDKVLIGVSGGPDSVALTHILKTIAAEYDIRLAIAHLNHGLRGLESDRDAEFVDALAGKLRLPFYLEKRDVRAFQRQRRLSPEEAARRIRYEFYKAVAIQNGFDKIALGHHRDDNAELILMNLLRGSGPLGLSGIAPVRNGRIIRPLIHLKRTEILDYISARGLAYVTDSSNTDPAYRRNQIRQHLIPMLKEAYNPGIVDSLNRLGELVRAEDRWMDQALEPIFRKCVWLDTNAQISLALAALRDLDVAAARRIIRKAVLGVKQDLRSITFRHVDSVLKLAQQGQRCGSLNLPGGLLVVREAETLTIKKERRGSRTEQDEYRYTVAGPGTTPIPEAGAAIRLVDIGCDDVPDFRQLGKTRALFDRDSLHFPLIIRNFRPGDRFSPLGVSGTQKLKKFFINNKVPPSQRKVCPLLLSAEKIVWIAGHRIDNSAKIGPHTKRVLMGELLLA